MREQRDEAVAQCPERGLGAGGEQQAQEGEDAVVGQVLAVDLGRHEIAHEVVARVGAPVFDDRQQVLDELGRRADCPLGVDRDRRDAVGPVLEAGVVAHRDTDDARDHLYRVLRRDVTHEIGATGWCDAVEQLLDGRLDQLGPPSFECRSAERLGDEVAVVAVLLAVHAEHGLAHDRTHHLVVDGARERGGVAQHSLDVVVAHHHERLALAGRTPDRLHRTGRASVLPHLVGLRHHEIEVGHATPTGRSPATVVRNIERRCPVKSASAMC